MDFGSLVKRGPSRCVLLIDTRVDDLAKTVIADLIDSLVNNEICWFDISMEHLILV